MHSMCSSSTAISRDSMTSRSAPLSSSRDILLSWSSSYTWNENFSFSSIRSSRCSSGTSFIDTRVDTLLTNSLKLIRISPSPSTNWKIRRQNVKLLNPMASWNSSGSIIPSSLTEALMYLNAPCMRWTVPASK